MSANLDQTALRILKAFEDNTDVFTASVKTHINRLSSRLDETDTLIRQTGSDLRDTVATSMKRRIQTSVDASHDDEQASALVCAAIIASLEYPGMEDRYEKVVEAHAKTFSWIFEPSCELGQSQDTFMQWLVQGQGIYWVHGKAASGKSTLMRYIFKHPALKSSLKAWSGRNCLITAKFYFWSLGSSLQQSQVGLFRSLLRQVFEESPELIRGAAPEVFKKAASLPFEAVERRHWSLPELKSIFLNLISFSKDIMLFFLVDGLDEFDGDYLELGAFLKRVSQYPNVKLCVSSRPVLTYEQQFDTYPNLRLQDLTADDITHFVHDKFTDHPRFSSLEQEDPIKSKDLVDEIVRTSSGVFLWVSLVVKSILKGFTNHDGISDLRRRLKELPPELDDLYSLMLSSVDPLYPEQASRLIQCVYQSPEPITVLELSFADDDDESLALKTKRNIVLPEQVE